MPDLRLEVPEFTSAAEWRWALTEDAAVLDSRAVLAEHAVPAEHEIRLDQRSWQFEAFADPDRYVSWHAAPDRRAEDETRIAAELGDWIGAEVFGPAITDALTRARKRGHVTVRITLPKELALRPLELARIDGKPLADRDITLVMVPPGTGTPAQKPGRDRLRVLGLFSLPDGERPANLRRARHALVTLVRELPGADITVLQYGVTRARLRDALEDGRGWDLIHICCHGAPGSLLFEDDAGRPDRITAAELAGLLDTARARVRLVTLAACQSAAETATGQPRQLPDQSQPRNPPERAIATPPAPSASLATELAASLGCAVLAMRSPVTAEFATALTGKLYDLLLRKGQTLPSALAGTLRLLASDSSHPALSVTAPALFGAGSVGLTLQAPEQTGPRTYSTDALKMPGFPPEPDRFVGRVGVMARASAALAPNSGAPGVLLHGMPGGGKTACALELAHTHEHAFDRLVWYKAPDEGAEISGALTDFALTLERYLDGFQMAHLVSDSAKLADFLPKLTELLKRNRLLIVIDNAESLLTDTGQWRDSRWEDVVGALTAHNGLGRVLLTSRRVPAVTGDSTAKEAVDALSPSEALLLARELPNLRPLLSSIDTARKLAADVLRVTAGHPKLLELANGQAADPQRLSALLDSSDAPSSIQDYLRVLAAWTHTVADTLSPAERDLFWFLCCLEEPDRIRHVLNGNWADLWRRLGRDGNPPELDQVLTALAARGLTALRKDADGEAASCPIHPGVAAVGRDDAGPGFQDAVDTEAAAYWRAVYDRASGKTGDGTVNTRLLVRAGLAAVPYLLRQQQWEHAAFLLESAFIQDRSRANAAAVLPAIEQITRHHPRADVALGRVLAVLDPAAGEARLRDALADAAARGDHSAAARAAAELVNLCRDSGRLAEALTLTGQEADHTRQAGHGPWTQLLAEAQRLQVLAAMGQASQVLDDVQRLRNHMDTLPATPGPDDPATPWHVREILLDTGHDAAHQLGQWQDALDLNADITASKRARRAPAAATARTRFNDYAPLLRLGRTSDALTLLRDCRKTFEDTHDTAMLGNTLSALADTEDERGHGGEAIRFERDALRYTYLAGDITGIAVSYHNLGNYLRRHARQPAPALASHLAAALIRTLTGIGGTGPSSATGSTQQATEDLRAFGPAVQPPATLADLYRDLGDIPGTDPAALIAQLSPTPETAERTLQTLITQAQALAGQTEQEP